MAHRVELLLKLLVGVVDAELLKTVDLERLKPADSHREDIVPSVSADTSSVT